MDITQIIFYFLAAVAVLSGVFVVSSDNLVRSVFMFFVTLFSVAGLYVFALADFVALTQVVIYVGGVLVLLLFTFMLSSKNALDGIESIKNGLWASNRAQAIVIVTLFLGILSITFFSIDFENLNWIKAAVAQKNVKLVTDNDIKNIGINLMGKYLLPLEMIAILLMMTLIGAAHIARKEPKE